MNFTLPKLDYSKDALSPIMSEETLDLHHGKHHQTYITNLINFSHNELHNYKFKRNFDYGPPHHNVSKISPYLRRRFLNEEEILRIVFKNHTINNIEKFIEEIFWRTYWRGWLESHPWIYEQYKLYNEEQFVPAKTGIKCFDFWKEELLDTGYLHNHSRMWFASIWIFTLGYSWQSGANFFKNNLLDYCPASNTLGWRWVAGLQTIGKPYIAKADNIKLFTNERFYPQKELKENYILNYQNITNGKSKDFIISYENKLKKCENLGVILNNNDLSLHQLFKEKKIVYDCCLFSKQHKNILINNFQKKIYEDIKNIEKDIVSVNNFKDIFRWIIDKNIKNLVLPYETIGNKILYKHKFLQKLTDLKVNFTFYLREWDANAFPYTTKGFFNFKKQIQNLLKKANL